MSANNDQTFQYRPYAKHWYVGAAEQTPIFLRMLGYPAVRRRIVGVMVDGKMGNSRAFWEYCYYKDGNFFWRLRNPKR